MRIGVVGSTGFLGRHILSELHHRGQDCFEFSRSAGYDARDPESVNRWIRYNNITHIINTAAICGGIGLNKEHPATLWAATSLINYGVLEGCKSHANSLDKVTMIGTVCSYAAESPVPFKERDLMHFGYPEITNAAYGVAKLSGLFGSMAYRTEYGLRSIYLVPVNMYGPGDNFNDDSSHVIPALIKKFVHAKENNLPTVECWGSGLATREFLFVKEAAQAIIEATISYDSPEPMNIGTGKEISIAKLAILIAEVVGYKGEIIRDESKPDGQMRRCLDTSKAKNDINFEAKIPLRDGIQQTVDWYLKHGRDN